MQGNAGYAPETGLQHTTTLAPSSHAAIPRETATIAEVLGVEGAVEAWASRGERVEVRGLRNLSQKGYGSDECSEAIVIPR